MSIFQDDLELKRVVTVRLWVRVSSHAYVRVVRIGVKTPKIKWWTNFICFWVEETLLKYVRITHHLSFDWDYALVRFNTWEFQTLFVLWRSSRVLCTWLVDWDTKNIEIGTRYKKVKSKSYPRPIYVPVKVTTLSSIRIELKDKNLNPVVFTLYDLHCVLHFRLV